MEEGDRAALCGGGNDRSPHEELAHAPAEIQYARRQKQSEPQEKGWYLWF